MSIKNPTKYEKQLKEDYLSQERYHAANLKEQNRETNYIRLAFVALFIVSAVLTMFYIQKESDFHSCRDTCDYYSSLFDTNQLKYNSNLNKLILATEENTLLSNFIYKNVNQLCANYGGAVLDTTNITISSYGSDSLSYINNSSNNLHLNLTNTIKNASIIMNCTSKQVYVKID
jgi:hypothetical protein